LFYTEYIILAVIQMDIRV